MIEYLRFIEKHLSIKPGKIDEKTFFELLSQPHQDIETINNIYLFMSKQTDMKIDYSSEIDIK